LQRYQAVLAEYIDRGIVTLISLTHSVPKYEDVAGFYGLQLHDRFAEIFFYQQCLSMHKGLSEYVIFLQINQFMAMNTSSMNTNKPLMRTIQSSIRQELQQHKRQQYEPSISNAYGNYGHSKYIHHASKSVPARSLPIAR